ncbi:hypothetical protein GDO78_015937 [Eleutherodactylus coqui]|uniref:Uncharacterized protein n=1 Tax=Eleutherodactylus coqui TaxID=57060 RepID=A0A8J6ED40_ELECQ|nr:hypothetical protein GDO78_015937 [Eleutherodactylus coqui]
MDAVVWILRTLFRRDDRGRKRKRDLSLCEEDPPKRRRDDRAQPQEEMAAFLRVFEDKYYWMFLACDDCMKISDKYLLAMVLVYFRRAGLHTEKYRKNFFPALFLANQMEEELPFRWQIYPWALGNTWMDNTEVLFQHRDQLLHRMGFKAWVDRTTCDLVMAEAPSHWAWTRERQPDHSLAIPMFRMDKEDFIISDTRFKHPYCILLCPEEGQYSSHGFPAGFPHWGGFPVLRVAVPSS